MVGTLGLKAVTLAYHGRTRGVTGRIARTLVRHDRPRTASTDYDPVWARLRELGVMPTFHSTTSLGSFTRTSWKNFVYNHFAAMRKGSVAPSFSEAHPVDFRMSGSASWSRGMGWACQLYADLLGHYAKRNKKSVTRWMPRRFDLDLAGNRRPVRDPADRDWREEFWPKNGGHGRPRRPRVGTTIPQRQDRKPGRHRRGLHRPTPRRRGRRSDRRDGVQPGSLRAMSSSTPSWGPTRHWTSPI